MRLAWLRGSSWAYEPLSAARGMPCITWMPSFRPRECSLAETILTRNPFPPLALGHLDSSTYCATVLVKRVRGFAVVWVGEAVLTMELPRRHATPFFSRGPARTT
jgi:hypothetical protein